MAKKYTAKVKYFQPSHFDLQESFYVVMVYAAFRPSHSCKKVSKKTRVIKFELVRVKKGKPFSKGVPTDQVLHELDKRGLRPALYEELLAFAAKYKRFRRPIAALGSICEDGSQFHAYVTFNRFCRGLFLHLTDLWWDRNTRFLAVRK